MNLLPSSATHSDQITIEGAFHRETVVSKALVGNPLNDPIERAAWVYTPPGYEASDRRYPVVYFFTDTWAGLTHGGTGSLGVRHFQSSWTSFFAIPTVNPAIVVLVDAWTSLGGSQYLNSPGTGRYLDYLAEDVVSAVDCQVPHHC